MNTRQKKAECYKRQQWRIVKDDKIRNWLEGRIAFAQAWMANNKFSSK